MLGPLPSHPGRPVGGVEAVVEILCQSLTDFGVQVVAIDPFTGYAQEYGFDFEVHRLAALPPWRMGLTGAPRELKQVVRRINPDVLHVHLGMQYCGLHPTSVATVHGFPHLESKLRNPEIHGEITARILERPFLRGLSKTKCVIAISPEVGQLANQLGVAHVGIPNPVDSRHYGIVRAPGRDFVGIGDIMRRKNQHFLIQGFKAYVSAGGNGNLLLIGGTRDFEYEALCRQIASDVANRVQFVGPQTRDQILHHLTHARASVSASLRETSSLAIAESLASNCPVLALDVGTASQQLARLSHGGLVLPVDSTIADLRAAFFQLAALKAFNDLRSHVLGQHPTSVASQTLTVYRSILTSPH